eukprot:TRINITY_DN19001_c0_g1_i1.p1 TRINITY_DN19001_c0_g1~~TRINITY_DN19001_c0_g1_i1.p1  ORF type:complete len:232 (-),score=34.40 TRINITY_DN19001_c0_g1_i1:451-1146(-)
MAVPFKASEPVPYNYPSRKAWTWKNNTEPDTGRGLVETHSALRPASAPKQSQPHLKKLLPRHLPRTVMAPKPRRSSLSLHQVILNWWFWTAGQEDSTPRELAVVSCACLRWLLLDSETISTGALLLQVDSDLVDVGGSEDEVDIVFLRAGLLQMAVAWAGVGATEEELTCLLANALDAVHKAEIIEFFEEDCRNPTDLLPKPPRGPCCKAIHQNVLRAAWKTNGYSTQSAL